MIFLPLLLLPFVIWANSPHLYVAYGFAYLWWARLRNKRRFRRSLRLGRAA